MRQRLLYYNEPVPIALLTKGSAFKSGKVGANSSIIKCKDSVEKLRDIEAMEERKLNEERIRKLSKPSIIFWCAPNYLSYHQF